MEEDDDSVPVLVYNVDPNGYHHHVLLFLLLPLRQYNSSNTVAFVFGIVDIVIVNIESMMMRRMLVHRIVVVAIPFGKCVG